MDDVQLVHREGQTLGVESDSDSDDSENSAHSNHPLDNCQAPRTRAPRGRPAKKRKHREDARKAKRPRNGGLPDIPDRAPPRCSTCNGVGHYARTCKRSQV
jgi:hypothetical protein